MHAGEWRVVVLRGKAHKDGGPNERGERGGTVIARHPATSRGPRTQGETKALRAELDQIQTCECGGGPRQLRNGGTSAVSST
jgi:hypothetical protein